MGIVSQVKGGKPKATAADPVLTRIVEQDTVSWIRKPNLRRLYLLLVPAAIGIEITSGFDSQLINALQIVPAWKDYFHHPTGSLQGIIAAAYSLGAIISLPFIPWVDDKVGRRGSIMVGSIIMIIGAIIQGFSVNVAMYIVARLILGFGIPACIVAGSSLIGELGYPKERPVLTSLFNVSYFVGQLIAAGIVFGTNSIKSNWAWRVPSLLQLAPSLLQVIFVLFLPESPRWLVSHDRVEEAEAILVKYHAEGNAESEFVKGEIEQIRTTIQLELEASKRSWLDLLRTSGMRRRTLVTSQLGLFTQWSGNTLISYYFGELMTMIGIENATQKQKLNVGYAAWSLVTGGVVALFVTKFRRRTLYMLCTVSLLLVYTGWTVAFQKANTAKEAHGHNGAASAACAFFIFAYQPCYNIGFNALTYTYMVEVWPYMERSRGIAVFQLFGRLAGFFTTYVNPIGLGNIKWKWLIVYVCWLTYEVIFVWFFFPETANRTLEELAFLFEGDEKKLQAAEAVEKAVHHEEFNIKAEKV
ncbi:general substrate transporter [Aaosphaeria arxii CBS 175.79]|uniref:General substrate transporter n=1 Tax=Aaosphaeria arxii CBS 175.79 TaxID=1450172 RepID=A0A6A5Y1V3_9PLEO|nr:general substrate transporter [Aaosphaeria arxii CBS 175.79]KAF2019199.1 general substrate transporter [Aaosphaeria arxii CBS 175.79]